MATMNDANVKIELETTYNDKGAQQAKADLQDLSKADAKPVQGSGNAAAEEAQRTQALAEVMRLEAKTRRELQEEIKRLIAARKEAAAAGDSERFSTLSAQLGRTKKAYGELQNAANLQKTAMMGQASAGMQFANTLGNLSSQLRSGQVDLAGMVNGVMSLGMALKAGLGPIGWVMAGIQALSTVIQLYIDRQKDAAVAAEKLSEAQNKAADAAMRAGKAIADSLDARARKAFEAAEKERKRELDNEKQATDNILNAKKARIADELKLLSNEQEQEEAIVQARIARGEASEKDLLAVREKYAKRREALNAELAGAEADAAVEKAAATLKNSQKNVDALKERLEGLKKQTGSDEWQKLDDARFDVVEEDLAALRENIQSEEATLREVEALAEKWRAGEDIDEVFKQAVLSKIGIVDNEFKDWGEAIAAQKGVLESAKEQEQLMLKRLAKRLGLDEDDDKVIKRLGEILRYRELKKTTEEQLRAEEDRLGQAQEEYKQAEEGKKRQQDINGSLKRRQTAEEAKRKAEEESKKREEEWRDKQKETHGEQLKYAREQLQGMKAGTDAYKKWAERVRTVEASVRQDEWQEVQKQTLEAQREWLRRTIAALPENSAERDSWMKQLDSNAAALRMKGWQEAQTRTLAEQQRYVKRMLAATQEGTQEWEKWALEARKLNNKGVVEEISKMEKDLKTSRNWAEEINKTDAQRLVEDGRLLREQQKKLRKLQSTPGMDAETQKRVNDLLRETKLGLTNYRNAIRKAGADAVRSLENAKMPDLRAKNKGHQRNVDLARKRYEYALRRATEAAAKGDNKGVAKWQEAMKKQARLIEKRTGWTGQAVGAMQQHMDNLKVLVASGARAQKAELIKRQEILRATASAAEEAKRKAAAEKKNREAAEREAKERGTPRLEGAEAKKPPAQPRETAQPAQPLTPPPTPQQQPQTAGNAAQTQERLNGMGAQLKSARAALESIEGGLGKLMTAIEGLVRVAERGASVIEPIPNRVALMQTALERKYNELEKRIEKIRTDI